MTQVSLLTLCWKEESQSCNDTDVNYNALTWSVIIVSIKLKYKKATQMSKNRRTVSIQSSETAECK